MATTSRVIDAAPDAVFAVLANGWTYGQWVVGTSHVRAVDPHWPEAGSRLHHAVGIWPLVVRDHTEVQECQPGRHLRLLARGWPLGEAEVDITLEAEGGGTQVTIREEPRRRSRSRDAQPAGRRLHPPAQHRDAASGWQRSRSDGPTRRKSR